MNHTSEFFYRTSATIENQVQRPWKDHLSQEHSFVILIVSIFAKPYVQGLS